MSNTKICIITHNGHFHADDVFAVALLSLLMERDGMSYEIIRTRDNELLKTGDYVVDVGGIYDEEKNKFDHHQEGGAGSHASGVPYSSFGLVWKKFGAEFCGSKEAANIIEKKMIEYIDARDNGINVVADSGYTFLIYDSGNIIEAFSPGWNEKQSFDDAFMEAVSIAKKILTREITKANGVFLAEKNIIEAYNRAYDKRVVVLDEYYPSKDILTRYSEPLYVIYPEKENGNWHVRAVQKNMLTFGNRKDFPKQWAGKRDAELAEITGINDSVFCHNNLFLAIAKSKEGAIALAKKALDV